MVQEGDSIFPELTLSHPAAASFRVYTPFGSGTATKNLDYSFTNQNINFGPSDFSLNTSSPINIYIDSVVEPDETFSLSFYLAQSLSTYDIITIGDSVKTITITDRNSESVCVLKLLLNLLHCNCSLYNFLHSECGYLIATLSACDEVQVNYCNYRLLPFSLAASLID